MCCLSPHQVDGEPCRLCPSTVVISLHNQVCMLQRVKRKQQGHSSLSALSAVGDLVQSFSVPMDDSELGAGDGAVRGVSVSPQPHPVSPPVDSSIRYPRSRSANNSPMTSPCMYRREVPYHSSTEVLVGRSASSQLVGHVQPSAGPTAVTPSSGLSSSSSDSSVLATGLAVSVKAFVCTQG